MAVKWSWDSRVKRYRNLDNGRFLAGKTVVSLRDTVIDAAITTARTLAEQAATGAITPEAFYTQMRTLLRDAHGAQYLFGRGGVNAMTPADFGRLGARLREQYGFLRSFAAQIDRLTPAQAAARAQLYIGATAKTFEQARAAAWEIRLPEYPGDACDGGANCRCSWSIKETDTVIEATWNLGGKDPCGPCQRNAATYNPLTLAKPMRPAVAPIVRLAARRRIA